MLNEGNKLVAAWEKLSTKYNLNQVQLAQFKLYLDQLITWNNKFNLTAITNELEIIAYHFDDALSLAKFVDLNNVIYMADVGSGGGFPGLPLKILYPHLKLVLIEVNGKKVEFLRHMIQVLELLDATVEQSDWRAFVRDGVYQVDLFCARASLQLEELVRIFKPASIYKQAQLVYWAAQSWKPEHKIAGLVANKMDYMVGNRSRKLVLFENIAVKEGCL